MVDIFRISLGLLFVFALLAVLVILSRKRGSMAKSWISVLPSSAALSIPLLKRNKKQSAPAGAQYSVLQKSRLSPTHQLFLLSCDGERILFCAHPQGCTVLRHAEERVSAFEKELKAELERPEKPALPAAEPPQPKETAAPKEETPAKTQPPPKPAARKKSAP